MKGGGLSFYLDIYLSQSNRTREFLGIYNQPGDPMNREFKRQAEFIRSQRELELLNGTYELTPLIKKDLDFLMFFTDYVENYSKGDGRIVRAAFRKFQKFILEERNLRSIAFKGVNTSLCVDFKDFLQRKAGLGGETAYNYFSRFKRALNRAVDLGFMKSNPAEKIKLNRGSNKLKKEILTEEELGLLKANKCPNTEVKNAFLFACYTGLGEAEIRSLKGQNLKNSRIRIVRQKLALKEVETDVLLHPSALQFLPPNFEKMDHIFQLPNSTAVKKNLDTWVQKNSGINKKITFYCARHTYAVLLLKVTGNLQAVSESLGHTSLKHTMKYLNHTSQIKDDAILKLPNL